MRRASFLARRSRGRVSFHAYDFAIALNLSAAAPAAFAMPASKAPIPAVSPANEAIIAVAKKRAPAKARPKARTRKARRGKPDLGGIHPLVGSGDY